MEPKPPKDWGEEGALIMSCKLLLLHYYSGTIVKQQYSSHYYSTVAL